MCLKAQRRFSAQVLTAGANWAAEPISGRRRLTVLTLRSLIKMASPAETPLETLICKHMKNWRQFKTCQVFV